MIRRISPLLPGALLLAAAGGAHAQDFSIDWWTMDSGGTTSSAGGQWQLAGTVGQFDATEPEAMTDGDWILTGGFWALSVDDLSEPAIFRDRFEG